MDLTLLKEIIIIALFLVVFLCVSIPRIWAHNAAQRSGVDYFHSERYSKIVSILNCFAAGIFLGTCLLHLFPDVRQNVTKAMEQIDPEETFPFAEFTIAMGFFLLLTIEQILADIRERRLNRLVTWNPNVVSTSANVSVQPDVSGDDFQEMEDDNASLVARESGPGNHNIEVPHNHESSGHHSQSIVTPDDQESYHSIRLAAMIVALSIHSTFEGVAIGVQTTKEEVIQITSALAIHKLVIAFSLGLALVQSNIGTMKAVLLGFIFAITSPLGIAVGLGVTLYEKDLDGSLTVGILQGMAAGTFLYVTFLDVLPHEFKHGRFHLPKLLSFIIGFSVICGSLFLFPDS
ncbi:unnamed protein product [Allacma fusca]|uniref:Zinc transporter ZIP1 n=1 Tax=Allacma fusca TaxID=39272 RepID=A0A8J2KKW9_9HEXA|nr:unnamed protein product [Allacma fusca]